MTDFEEIIRDAVVTAVLDMDVEALMNLVRPQSLTSQVPIKPTDSMLWQGGNKLYNNSEQPYGTPFGDLPPHVKERYKADAGDLWDTMLEAYIGTDY